MPRRVLGGLIQAASPLTDPAHADRAIRQRGDRRAHPADRGGRPARRADPGPAGDLQRPVLLPVAGRALVRHRRAGARPDDRADGRLREEVPDGDGRAGLRARAGRRLLQHRGRLRRRRQLPRQVPQEPHPAHFRLLGEVLLQARATSATRSSRRASRPSASTSATTGTSRRARGCSGCNGAEIVFNPSATVAGLSQYLWKLEQPAHAVANGYFMACSNRVGTEAPWNIGRFYGSSYFVDPRGKFLATGSEDKDELVVAEMDLDLIEEVRRVWQFYRDRRPDSYGADGGAAAMSLLIRNGTIVTASDLYQRGHLRRRREDHDDRHIADHGGRPRHRRDGQVRASRRHRRPHASRHAVRRHAPRPTTSSRARSPRPTAARRRSWTSRFSTRARRCTTPGRPG